ncbi:MAG: hypothetical protein QXU13_02690 [Desulfurococcaceae archaeon]
MTWQEIISVMREKIRNYVPGLLEALDLMCIREIGTTCHNAFFEKPGKFRDMLLKMYGGGIDSALYIVFNVFVKPLFEDKDDRAWELAKLFIRDPDKSIEIIKEIVELVRYR